jgi:hypothetical protein
MQQKQTVVPEIMELLKKIMSEKLSTGKPANKK